MCIDFYLLMLLGLYIHTQVLSMQSFVELESRSQEAVRTAKWFGFPEGLGWEGDVCGTVATEVTLSQERSSFDLIIWEGQSAFVDEESL